MRYNEQINLKLYTYTNNAFTLQAIIDDYQEISFSHNLYEAGDFTITINYNIPNALKFERGMFVQFGDNPYDFGEIITISDSIGEDGKGSQTRTITGKDARYILKRRVIKNMNSNGLWAMTDKGEIVLRNLIKDQCGSSAEAKRQLPITNTIPASADAKGKVYSVSENFTNLYEVCKTIATQSEIGWRMSFDGTLTLEVFEGADLSQTVRFDTNFESLANGEFTDSSDAYSNAIYIGGKGQNDDRDIYEGEDGTPEGLDRFESWDNQSSLTIESEYEAEALSMLTQYGQTLTMSGNGLAKCPYVFREQYDIGDTVTVAFSGKSATAQILSITEHWTWGSYDISFSFGKPQNNLADQLQLMLRKIQEASNKTNSTDSVRWYTIPTDTAMPKADVTYNTIGFVGTVGTGATFTLYLDNEKTGAKTYHIYFKQLGGTGKLTLTTGKAGASNLTLNAGTYVAIIYVDENGNVTNTASTPTATIESGNNQPITSDGLANSNAMPVNSVTSGNMHSVTSGAVYESMGIIWQGTVTMASDITSVYNWCKTHYVGSRVCAFRISSVGQASSEPFGTSSVTVIYCMSSTNYGWIQGFSDNATCNMAISYINSTVSAWQKISYGAVSSYPSPSMQSEIRTQFNNTAQYNEFKGNSMASEEGAWWGYRHSNYGSGIFISRGDVVAFYLDTYGTFESKYIFRR